MAYQSGLRVGDRILEVNAIDLRHATHQEAVRALLSNKQEIRMLVRRDPSPPGMEVLSYLHRNVSKTYSMARCRQVVSYSHICEVLLAQSDLRNNRFS